MAEFIVKQLGLADYATTLAAMRHFTDTRSSQTTDEIWLLQHPSVFTMGQAAKPEHLLSTGDIPVVQTERGGQVTYHGPGQVIAYVLFDLVRARITVKGLVCKIEQAAIDTLADFDVIGERQAGKPGVYLSPAQGGAKIAALGLKIRKGSCFHGVAINAAMDLLPFDRINPCGYPNMPLTDIASTTRHSGPSQDLITAVTARLAHHLQNQLQAAPFATSSFKALPLTASSFETPPSASTASAVLSPAVLSPLTNPAIQRTKP